MNNRAWLNKSSLSGTKSRSRSWQYCTTMSYSICFDDVCCISPPEKTDHVAARNEINIIFVGKSGAGKSTLKNNILNLEDELQLSTGSITEKCDTKCITKHGVTLNITDTAGLQGGKAECRATLKKVSREIGVVDLLVYCLPVDLSSKFNDAQPVIMESLQEAFGRDIWKNCIVVFTFSNLVLDRIRKKKGASVEATEMYKTHIKDYASKFEDKLKEMKVNGINVKTVYDVAGNNTTIPAIPAGDNSEDQVLPGIESELLKIEIKTSKDVEMPEGLFIKMENETHEVSNHTWEDAVFFEIVKKSSEDLKWMLLRYRYGLYRATIDAIGAIVSGTIGILRKT